MTIGVIAKIKVADGRQEAFERLFRELAAAVRAKEPGNKVYQVCRSRSDPALYVALEVYDSDESLQQHGVSEHMRAARPRIAELLAGRPEIEVFDAVE